jgi:Undecaprenyl-phosphate glucose phosphotransferase
VCNLEEAHKAVEWGVDDVVIAVPPAQLPLIPKLMPKLGHFCVPVRAIVDLGDDIILRDKMFQFGRLQMLNLGVTPLESIDYSILKRTFDIGFSSIVILFAWPLLLAIAIAVRLSSPGPVLFRQERVGLNGRVFSMLKFRTMRVSPAGEADTRWTTADDPRKTRLGTFLRKTSLDELPQFFNVLKGDMSVVGPRPERPFFVRKFLKEVAQYNSRHKLKVGITGWAQVNGWRGDTSIQKRIEYDLYYLQNWSFGFDLRIVAMTILGGLLNRNAY